MKPEELFTGAWVQPKNVKAPFQVCSVDSELVCDAAESPWCLDEIEPILITSEILEKIGFKKDTGGEECWGCKIGWLTPHHYNRKYFPTSWEVQICARNSFSGVIKYVHQLQAALRVCKIKKEIVL